MNFRNKTFAKGKIVYYIDGQSFENTPNKNDGKEKAIQYCLDNFIDQNLIKKFDSRLERDRYIYLLDLQRQGKISNLTHHFLIKIQDAFYNANNDLIPPITYEADFIYRDLIHNTRVVEDVKGSEYFIDERFITLKQVFDNFMKDKNLYLKVVMLKNNERVEWKIGEKKKSQKLIKKQRERIKTLEKEKHDKLIIENKIKRLRARKEELMVKLKLTKREKERLKEINKFLGENEL